MNLNFLIALVRELEARIKRYENVLMRAKEKANFLSPSENSGVSNTGIIEVWEAPSISLRKCPCSSTHSLTRVPEYGMSCCQVVWSAPNSFAREIDRFTVSKVEFGNPKIANKSLKTYFFII